MINPVFFYEELKKNGIDFFTGVPDSLLKNICACITDKSEGKEHIISANEGNAAALAAGYHLATGKIPLVYMQNSGLGNIINPLMSLTCSEVYGIPMILLIGWRGEPGTKDEPQHVKQGAVTLELLKTMGIPYDIVPDNEQEAATQLKEVCRKSAETSSPSALVVRKDTFDSYVLQKKTEPLSTMTREDAIELIVHSYPEDTVFLSTTGHISRELYEIRKKDRQVCRDFLNVGSMGHVSQIALGVALNKPEKTVVCLDGDGAALMHTGGLRIIAEKAPANLHHVILNNGVHGSVGGQPTAARGFSLAETARVMGYKQIFTAVDESSLRQYLEDFSRAEGPVLMEVLVSTFARKDLGRPQETPQENKRNFMKKLETPS
ncbi:phosphonopyruvate decarboxylase [Oceanispirochaeta sp.]|jgi:phosphonopyruvate decarboxylase|uniref:phosphonopyruvate decarboxylase n=1 Tax=Oceanispirochaeta sp. TaxID=2035350 RepID=UPI00261DBCDF|nr:phosphonopyruvate decarboxylase [Oceanispirochaeta sp.]MDA3956734.1 phosphonopyruvate decarboxylase [Oceanispirochaeta sp.]